MGITAPLHGALSSLAFYGRGPHENYADRKYGAHMGVHRLSVPALHCPYVFPQVRAGPFARSRGRMAEWEEGGRGLDGPRCEGAACGH